jgi:hypothetical protein
VGIAVKESSGVSCHLMFIDDSGIRIVQRRRDRFRGLGLCLGMAVDEGSRDNRGTASCI